MVFFSSDKLKYGPYVPKFKVTNKRVPKQFVDKDVLEREKKEAAERKRRKALSFGSKHKRRDKFRLDLEPILKKDLVLRGSDVDFLRGPSVDKKICNELFDDMRWELDTLKGSFKHGKYRVKINQYIDNGSFGVVYLGEYFNGKRSKPCVIKMINIENIPSNASVSKETLFKNSVTEMLAHYIIQETCDDSDKIYKEQEKGRMARVPNIFAAFTVNTYELEKLGGSGNIPIFGSTLSRHLVIVMEPLTQSASGHLRDVKTRAEARFTTSNARQVMISTAAALIMYQTINLIIKLQDKLNFCHRDLHFGNMMVKTDGTQTGRCHNTFFHTYLIDFGMSRLEYKGKTISTFETYDEDYFNPYHDVVFLQRSLKPVFKCDLRYTQICSSLTEDMNFVNDEILSATGIDFTKPENTGKHTMELYHSMQQAGPRMQRPGVIKHTPITPTSVIEHRIDPVTFKKIYSSILRQLARRCTGHGQPTTGTMQDNFKLREILRAP